MQVHSPTLTADLCLIHGLLLLGLGFTAPSSICQQEQSPQEPNPASPQCCQRWPWLLRAAWTLGDTLRPVTAAPLQCHTWLTPAWHLGTFPAWALLSSPASCICRTALCGWASMNTSAVTHGLHFTKHCKTGRHNSDQRLFGGRESKDGVENFQSKIFYFWPLTHASLTPQMWYKCDKCAINEQAWVQ